MAATPPLARVLRYGSVRQTDTDLVRGVLDSILIRICARLAASCMSLDSQAASAMLAAIEDADAAVALVGSGEQVQAWHAAQRAVADLAGAVSILQGRCVRLLLDAGLLSAGEAQQRLARALSAGPEAVAWLEGFVRGSGSLLLRDEPLWNLLDEWLSGLSAEAFDAVLPLLRRAFSQFTGPERQQMGTKVRARHGAARAAGTVATDGSGDEDDWDESRVRRVLDVVAIALGGRVTDE
ncbi:MAG TPA: DUF5682 family protein, partial [Streptosporangiaceae bacterium]|nr:DUF5682 family protein [Streptosporangiaceae bacterium]